MKLFDMTNEKYHMGHFIWDALRSRPDAVCQIDAATGESQTNGTVLRRTIQLARCLRHYGAQPGDVLTLSGRNHLDIQIPFYAAVMIGLPLSGVDPQFKYNEIKTQFKICSPKIAFCQRESLDDHLRSIKDLDLDTKLICFDDDTEYSMKRFIQEYDKEDRTDFEPLEFDLDQNYAWLVSTGGTTGVIKLAAFKHRTFFKKLLELKTVMPAFSPDPPENGANSVNKPVLHLSPVQWISAFFSTVCNPFMKLTQVMTSAPLTTEHFIDMINKYKPVSTVMGPSALTDLLKSEKKCDLSCFNMVSLIGSKVRKEFILELKSRLRPGAIVSVAYGQTENLGLVLIPNPTGPVGTCGKCPPLWQNTKIKLVNPDSGADINEPNVTGEMWTKITCFSEYYKNPEETKKAFTEDGWYKTGDLLYRDEDGDYYFVERLKLLIKYRNYQIIPPELEAVILQHPGVRDVSVTSIPHEADGEHPVACVVRRNGCQVTAEEIKDLVASNRSDSQKLRGGVVFMDNIPLTSTGKVARGKLKEMVLAAHRE